MIATQKLPSGIFVWLVAGTKRFRAHKPDFDARDLDPYPGFKTPLARVFGRSGLEDSGYNGRGPKGVGRGAVIASWLALPEEHEESDWVREGDPERGFVELDSLPGPEYDFEDRNGIPGSLIEVFGRFGTEEGYLEILRAVTLQPALFAVAYVMARNECLARLVRFLPAAMETAIERFGAMVVIEALSGQAVTLEGKYYASSIRALQDAARIEKVEYNAGDRVFEPAATRMLFLLGYTMEDIVRHRPQPVAMTTKAV